MASDIIAINGSSLSNISGIAKFSNNGDTTMAVGNIIDFKILLDNKNTAIKEVVCSKGTITITGNSNYRLTLNSEIGINEELVIAYTLTVPLEKTTTATVEIVATSNDNYVSNGISKAIYTQQKTSSGKIILLLLLSLLTILGIRKYKQLKN